MPKFKLTNLKFEKIMADYAKIREVTIPEAVHANARLLCVELARRTQPFGDKTGGEKVGEKAITRDLLGRSGARPGIFAPISGAVEAGFEFYKTSNNVRLFVTKDGRVYGTDKSFFRPDASVGDMAAFHRGKFVNGKMSSAGSRTRDVGRWKFIEKMFVPPGTLDDFMKAQFARVGIAKSGWAACANQLRRVVSGSMTRGNPGWVTRHLGDYSLGSVEDRTFNLKNPTVVLTNSCKYADKVLRPSEQLMALSVVAEKMKNQMSRILKGRITKLAEAA